MEARAAIPLAWERRRLLAAGLNPGRRPNQKFERPVYRAPRGAGMRDGPAVTYTVYLRDSEECLRLLPTGDSTERAGAGIGAAV
jgi:hypothetical protein